MKIWMDEQFRPHETRFTKEFIEIEKAGFTFVHSVLDIGASVFKGKLVRGEEIVPVIVHWTNTTLPLRWMEVPDTFSLHAEKRIK